MGECNFIDSTYLTYYQANKFVILNRAKDYYEDLSEEKKKKKKENIVKIDITICLKKKTKIKRISKKLS